MQMHNANPRALALESLGPGVPFLVGASMMSTSLIRASKNGALLPDAAGCRAHDAAIQTIESALAASDELPDTSRAFLVLAHDNLLHGNTDRAAAAISCAAEDLPAGHSMRLQLISLADALFVARR
jgi:hypothetical protein